MGCRYGRRPAEQPRDGPLTVTNCQIGERGSRMINSNLPFDEWTETFCTERLTGALLDRLTHHVNTLEMNDDSYHLGQSRARKAQVAN